MRELNSRKCLELERLVNKRECPQNSCRRPLSEADDAALQNVINTTYNGESVVMGDLEHELACGHKVRFGASNIQGVMDFWLTPE